MSLIDLVNVLVTEFRVTLDVVVYLENPITFGLALLNSCLNPLLYVFMGQDFKHVFRRSVLKVLEKAFTEEPPQNNTSTTPRRSPEETASSDTQV